MSAYTTACYREFAGKLRLGFQHVEVEAQLDQGDFMMVGGVPAE